MGTADRNRDRKQGPKGRFVAMLLAGLCIAAPVAAREVAVGGARFAVPDGYERTDHDDPDSASFVLESVARVQCVFTLTPGYQPVGTLLREFVASWSGAEGAGAAPEPRRATNRVGARYVVGEGRPLMGEGGKARWLQMAIVDFDDRQRHIASMIAATEADVPRCRKDADALLASLRAEPGWVPQPVEEPAAEPSVEDLTLLNGKAAAVELLWCESKKKQRQRCPADTSAGVIFVGRTSFAECEDGKSYWVEDDAIVVDKGCRARFAVRAADGADARGERFACESFLKDSIYCDLYRIDRGVRIGRVLSRAPCVWNESWGVLLDDLGINSYVWVANGCRAEFHRW